MTFLNLKELRLMDFDLAISICKRTCTVHMAFSSPKQACDDDANIRLGFDFNK